MKYSSEWSRLDNAAKIFPPTSTKRDSKVFRFVCELNEDAEPEALQRALVRTLEQFPFYKCVLKKGLFWFYFEESTIRPVVAAEGNPPCHPLYRNDSNNLLFEVSYYRSRINFEVYHALADGMGALLFFRQLVAYYLADRYDDSGILAGLVQGTTTERSRLDSFSKYYSKEKPSPGPAHIPAYQMRGEKRPGYRLGVIEGRFSVSSALETARRRGVTLTELLAAAMMCAIHEGMTLREERKPVVISIPVDLRKYFPTESARNFFGIANISHNFMKQGKDFDDVLAGVKESLKEQLDADNLKDRMNRLTALEHNISLKIVPLMLKIPVLKVADWYAGREVTAALSNLGRIAMPEAASSYIRQFSVFASTKRIQACMCSYGDALVVTFTSPLTSTDAQCRFFTLLSSMGLKAEITSNIIEQVGE